MAKKKNNTARKEVSDITGAKPEGFDAKADAGDFKKARAGSVRDPLMEEVRAVP